jgi:unsaturated rhamnogalacturonyl hydrolase
MRKAQGMVEALSFAFAPGFTGAESGDSRSADSDANARKVINAHIDREGNIREICVGTGQINDIEFYLKRPSTLGDLHGQAPFLWLAVARMNGASQ